MPSPNNNTNITPPRVPLIDERTGLIAREWYRFFLNLFVLTGSGGNVASLTDLQLGPPVVTTETFNALLPDVVDNEATVSGLQSQIAELATEVQALAVQPPSLPAPNTAALLPVSNVTLTGSPFTYQNTNAYTLDIMISGAAGTATNVEFSRDGTTFLSTGALFGMFMLSPNDTLRITYVAAPTVTAISR